MDFYAGVWLFAANKAFYPGEVVSSQEPMGAFQFYVSYNFNPRLRVAINTTYYLRRASSFDGQFNDDCRNNTRVGITAVVPTGKLSSLKLAASTDAVVRIGQDFSTLSIGWQKSWLSELKRKRLTCR